MKRHYVFGQNVDEPLVWYEGATPGSGNRNYLHTDELGSVVATSDNSGGVTSSTVYAYDSYGRPANDNWTGSRFRYTGQIALNDNASVHLYYYKARVYDPVLGRFLQTDPIGYADGLNWYSYTANDPTSAKDPMGTSVDGSATAPTDDDTVTVTADRCNVRNNYCSPDNYLGHSGYSPTDFNFTSCAGNTLPLPCRTTEEVIINPKCTSTITVNLFDGADGAGHLGISVDGGPSIGFYGHSFAGQPGEMKPDRLPLIDSISIPATPEQAAGISQYLAQEHDHPPEFTLTNHNCAWACSMALLRVGIDGARSPGNVPRFVFEALQRNRNRLNNQCQTVKES